MNVEEDIATMDDIVSCAIFSFQTISLIKLYLVLKTLFLAPLATNLDHVVRDINTIYVRSIVRGDLKCTTAYTTANVQDLYTGSKPKQPEKLSRGFFTTWADKVSPICQLVIGYAGLSILLLVKIL